MKFNQLTNTFTAGEWSPKMRARTDAEEYPKSCELLQNFLPKIQGGAFRRTGTVRVGLAAGADADIQLSTNAYTAKMIAAVGSDGTRKVLCINGATPSTTWTVFDAAFPNGSGANPSMVSGADFVAAPFYVRYTQVGDFIVLAEYSSGVGKIPRIWRSTFSTPGDVRVISGIDSNGWKAVPYRPPEALGSSVNITISAGVTMTASSAYFNAGHVGAYFKFSQAGTTFVVLVTGYTSTTVVTGSLVYGTRVDIAYGTAAGTSWEESAWSTYRGWPRSVCAYQGRLIFGGSSTHPDTLWGSRIGNVLDFMERPLEQDTDFTGYENDNGRPFTLTPSADIGPIKNISSGKTLVVLGEKGELVGYGTNGALGPNDVSFESSSNFGANLTQPVRVNNFLTFVQKGGRRVRDIIFNQEENIYKSTDLTFVADHLTYLQGTNSIDEIVSLTSSETDSSIIYANTLSGRLLALTIDRDYKVNAWSRVVLGGKSQFTSYPNVVAVCAIPRSETYQDTIFLLVQRYMDGAFKTFVEFFDVPKESNIVETSDTISVYVDLKMYYSTGVPTTTVVSGLSYLEGETMQIVADGEYIGEFTADASGNFTVPNPATYFTFGYKYESTIKTSPIEIGQQIPGTPQGLMKRIDEVTVKFENSYGAKYGYKESSLEDINFSDPNRIMGDPIKLFTGYKLLKFEGNYDRECQVVVKTDKPWPCNVLAIISKGVTYD